MINFDKIQVGDQLPEIRTQPISRSTLALFAGASGDHNPIHIDIDFAQKAGLDDVFAHGMLSMAYLGRLLTGWVPQTSIRNISVRFTNITQLNSVITCTGVVEEKLVEEGNNVIILFVNALDEKGEIKVSGSAEIVIC